MNTNTEIKPWQERFPRDLMGKPSPEQIDKAKDAEIAELRAALEAKQGELDEWRFTNKVDELQRDNERLRALAQRAGSAEAVAWAYECLQPQTDNVWVEFFSREEPSKDVTNRKWLRNVQPLYTALPPQPERTKLQPMQSQEDQAAGIVRQWYFDCDGHYIDVALDNGKYSIFFRDRATQGEGWLDQSEQPDSGRDAADAARWRHTLDKVQFFQGRAWLPSYDTHDDLSYITSKEHAQRLVLATIESAIAAQQGEKGGAA